MTTTPLTASVRYQWLLTALLSLNFGFVLFDRNALAFLMPFVQGDLGLDNSQIGMLAAALSLTWALAAFFVGMVADRFGSRKQLLVAATCLFALCSFGSGLAIGFGSLLLSRLVMGFAEGGIMPLSHSLLVSQVAPARRGIAMGIAQGFGSSLMGSFVAPVVLVAFATAFGWREAFFLAGAPGLLLALLLALWVQPDHSPTVVTTVEKPATLATLRLLLTNGNVLRCAVMSCAFVGYLVMCWTFMPLYLTQVRGYAPATMSWLMGILGIAATLFSFAITGLSDRIGRRPLLVIIPFLSLLLPLGTLYLDGSLWLIAVIFFLGWMFTGIMPLFMATVPAESVDVRLVGSALGLCMGGSEIIGGVLAPLLGGYAADLCGLQAPLWGMVLLALFGAWAALGLQETAPRVVARNN